MVYKDGKLSDMTNVVVSNLDVHEVTWVKSNLDSWQEPVGMQPAAPTDAWDPAHAPDPSIHRPRPRHAPPQEQAAPEEEAAGPQALDRPGDAEGDSWLAPWDQDEVEQREVEEQHQAHLMATGRWHPCGPRDSEEDLKACQKIIKTSASSEDPSFPVAARGIEPLMKL